MEEHVFPPLTTRTPTPKPLNERQGNTLNMFIEQPARWIRWLYPHALWRMSPDDHSVYLTFDDGPIPEATPFIPHCGYNFQYSNILFEFKKDDLTTLTYFYTAFKR